MTLEFYSYAWFTIQNGGPSGTPSDGVTLGPVTFSADNVVAAVSGADRAYVLCGASCVSVLSYIQ